MEKKIHKVTIFQFEFGKRDKQASNGLNHPSGFIFLTENIFSERYNTTKLSSRDNHEDIPHAVLLKMQNTLSQ